MEYIHSASIATLWDCKLTSRLLYGVYTRCSYNYMQQAAVWEQNWLLNNFATISLTVCTAKSDHVYHHVPM